MTASESNAIGFATEKAAAASTLHAAIDAMRAHRTAVPLRSASFQTRFQARCGASEKSLCCVMRPVWWWTVKKEMHVVVGGGYGWRAAITCCSIGSNIGASKIQRHGAHTHVFTHTQERKMTTSFNSKQSDMIFCILFIGDSHLLRDMVRASQKRLAGDWEEDMIADSSIMLLRTMLFLLVDRDYSLKEKIIQGYPELCISGMDPQKADGFFRALRKEIIDPWLIDERKNADDLVSAVTDLYLVC